MKLGTRAQVIAGNWLGIWPLTPETIRANFAAGRIYAGACRHLGPATVAELRAFAGLPPKPVATKPRCPHCGAPIRTRKNPPR